MLKRLRLTAVLALLLGGGLRPAAAQALRTPPLPPLPADLQAALRRDNSPANYATAMQLAGVAYYTQGDTAGALAYSRVAVRLARRLNNAVLLAEAYDVFSNVYFVTGQLPQALHYAQLELAQWGRRPEAAGAHNLIGYIYIKMGRTAEALAAFDRAYRAFGQARNARSQLLVDNARGALYLRNDQLDSASFYLVRAARGFHQIRPYNPRNAPQESVALGNLATVASMQKRPADAIAYARQALAIDVAGAAQNPFRHTATIGTLSKFMLDADSLPQALRYARQALGLARQARYLDEQKYALLHLGTYYLRTNQPDSAVANYQRAVALTKQGGIRISQGQALQDLADCYYKIGRPADALRQAQAVEALDSAARDPGTTLANLRLLGQLAHDRHDEAAALGYFQRQRTLELRQAAAASSKQMAALRVRFGVERTEQQLSLLQARSQAQAQQAELLRLQAAQREGAYRDTLSRRTQRQQQERLRQQLLAQQQAAQAERSGQQVLALTQRTRAQAQQARLQQQALRLAAQQQELARLRARQERAGLGGGAALLLLGAGGLFRRYRRRQTAQVAALRQRLAADLHDDVGHLLTQITMQSSLLREGVYAPAQAAEQLDQLAATARRAAQQMHEAVWDLSHDTLTLHQLVERLRDHAHEVLPPAGLAVDFDARALLAGPDRPLPAPLRQGLYLLYKEALHNVVKHARATHVRIALAPAPAGLALAVADDGRGLPPPDGRRRGGRGLPGMQARAQALGGTARVAAGAEGGTMVQVEVPL